MRHPDVLRQRCSLEVLKEISHSPMRHFWPSTTTTKPSFIFCCSSSEIWRHLLKIVVALVTLERAPEQSLAEMLVDVVEGMLGDVADDQAGMLSGLTTAVALCFTRVDLAGTVPA